MVVVRQKAVVGKASAEHIFQITLSKLISDPRADRNASDSDTLRPERRSVEPSEASLLRESFPSCSLVDIPDGGRKDALSFVSPSSEVASLQRAIGMSIS